MRSIDVGCWKHPCCLFNIDSDKDIISDLAHVYKDRFFVVADAEYLPFKSGCFDYIRANDIIEHVKKPELFVSEISRCLMDDGHVFVRTPVYPVKYIYDIVFDGKLREWEDVHVSKFTVRTFRALIKKYLPRARFEPFMFKKISKLGRFAEKLYGLFPRKVCAVIEEEPRETDKIFPFG